MRNVTCVGLCWTMTLGLVAVALGQQQLPSARQDTRRETQQDIGRNAPGSETSQPDNSNAPSVASRRNNFDEPTMQAPDAPRNRSLLTYPSRRAQSATSGEPQRGQLGVWMAANDGPGVRILRVTPGSAAEQAGLRPGDYVLLVNGRGASSPQHAAQMIKQIPIGQSGTLTIWRDGDQQELQISLQPARDRDRDIASDTGREMNRDSYQTGFQNEEGSTNVDSSSRINRLEQQLGSLSQELAAMRQEMAQLRSGGSVQTTGFNAEANQSSTPSLRSAQNSAAPTNATPGSTNTLAPPPGFGTADGKAINSPAEPPASPTPAAAPAEPPKSSAPTPAPADAPKPATPAPPAEKPALNDASGSASPQPKSDDKPNSNDKSKSEDKPKQDDKAGSDDLFK